MSRTTMQAIRSALSALSADGPSLAPSTKAEALKLIGEYKMQALVVSVPTRSETCPMGDLTIYYRFSKLYQSASDATSDEEACIAARAAIALKMQPARSQTQEHAGSDEIV